MKNDHRCTYGLASFFIVLTLMFISSKAYAQNNRTSIEESTLKPEEKCLLRFYEIYKRYMLLTR